MNQSQKKTYITQKQITFSRRGIVVNTIEKSYLIDPGLRFVAGSNPDFSVLEVCHGQSLHKYYLLLIRLDSPSLIIHFARTVHPDQI